MSKNLACYIDHTLLKPEATKEDIIRICSEAIKYNVSSVCINGKYARLVSDTLKGSDVKTCCVVDFPLGASKSSVKAFEAAECINDGAQEIDMVISVGAAKEHDWVYVEKDISAVAAVCKGKALLKVIIECCLLTDDEKVQSCLAAKKAGADFVKTSTGFSYGGATTYDVSLMRNAVRDDLGVKAAGGIRTKQIAEEMLLAGASRIGASATVAILNE